MTTKQKINRRSLRALEKLSYMQAIVGRIDSVWATRVALGRSGIGEFDDEIIKDNQETQDEMIERFVTF